MQAQAHFLPPHVMEVFQAKYIPCQDEPKPEHLFEGMSTKALITSWPPLGQVTRVKSGKIEFTVYLGTDEAGLAESWEVVIWYSDGQSAWKELPLLQAAVAKGKYLPIFNKSEDQHPRVVFAGSLNATSSFRFTIKFKNLSEPGWKWVRDHQGLPDVHVDVVSKSPQSVIEGSEAIDGLADLLGGLNTNYKTHSMESQSPETSIWEIEVLVAAAGADDKSTFALEQLGHPFCGDFKRWMALIRIWSPWLAPRQGGDHFELDRDAIMCSFLERSGDRHIVLLAVSGVDDVQTTFKTHSNDNQVYLQIRNDGKTTGRARVILAVASSFESANCAAMYHARTMVQNMSLSTGEEQKDFIALKDGVRPQWMENWFDGLTYCTWNALGQDLTDEKVLSVVDTLAENNINITNLIIDDGWQTIDKPTGMENQFQQGWMNFEADPTKFKDGLKSFITKLRKKHPNLQHIAVWHALLGYWAGISPDGEIAKKYKINKVLREDNERRNLPLGGMMTVVAAEDAQKMYNDFYAFLEDCGIDAVKTDAQFMLDTLVSASARSALIPAYLNAWTISALGHFSIKAISCMSQTPAIIFRNQLPNNRPPILLRNSDDFFPEVPSSHTWHVFSNANNALFNQHLNCVPDWDMFQTVHEYSSFHAAARCVSGGPVYITDIPGKHNIPLIKEMTGETVHGKTVIFRPSTFGKTISPYQGYDDPALLKVSTYHGAAVTGTGIIGVFNVSPRPLSELVHLSLFPGTIEAQLYVVRSHTSGRVTKPLQLVDYGLGALMHVSLEERGWEILSAFPLRGFVPKGVDETMWIASLGLLGKMTGAAAKVSETLTMAESGRIEVVTSLKALGVWGVYISDLPHWGRGFMDRLMITVLGKVIPEDALAVNKDCKFILEVDLERAWKKLELVAGYSNEVEVKLSILP